MKQILLAMSASLFIGIPATTLARTANDHHFKKEFFQTNIIRGAVTNSNGEPLSGVTVQVKGFDVSVVTGADGTFSIDLPSNASTLVFSYVGMENQEFEVRGKNNIAVQLQGSETTLSDVVVIGYGTQKKANLT